MITLSDDDTRRQRSAAQLLSGTRLSDPLAIAARLTGMQAQSIAAFRLNMRVRADGLTEAVVRQAVAQGAIVRTWAMRGTLHMLAASDVRWLNALLGPRLEAGGRRRRAQLGLDDDLCERALRALRSVLAERGPLPRAALIEALADRGARIEAATQAPAHLLFLAAARGLICRGPDLDDDEPTYALLDDWVPASRSRTVERPAVELANRYLHAHAPASAADFARWSGLPARQARDAFAALASESTEVQAAGISCLLPRDATPPPRERSPEVRLLSHFDEYLLGWASRDLILAATHAHRIQAGGGWIHPTVIADGRVVGRWQLRRRSGRAIVEVEAFETLSADVLHGIDGEVADIGRFLGMPATFRHYDAHA